MLDYTFGNDEIAQRTTTFDSSGLQLASSNLVFGHDGHGSVRVIFDLATTAATIAQVFTFAPYGEMLAVHDSLSSNSPLATRICIVTDPVFEEIEFGHLRFSLYDAAHSLAFGDQIQLHLIQLSKYHLSEGDLAGADAFERWVYFLTESQNRNPDELRQLLPDPAFDKATRILEMISKSPELRLIYDDRAKEAKDRYSEIKDANAEGE